MILKGKTAIITGASRGIGKAIAQRFFKEGADILAIARDSSALIQLVKEMRNLKSRNKIIPVCCDVSRELEVECGLNFIEGKKIVLVNAAGLAGVYAPVSQSNFSDWKRVFEVNVFGTYLMMKHVLPQMRENRAGKIINFYGGGDGPLPGFSAYGASKAAVARLTETIAKEVKPFGIDVNVISPGPVKTKLFDEMFKASGQNPPPTVGAEKAVELALFLASEQSNGLTGKFLSAVWDNWQKIPDNLELIMSDPDIFTLRRRKGEL